MLAKKRVVVGMSGGVDSSVTAALLKEAGFEVFGLAMELYSCDKPLTGGCCTPKDRLDARKVCEKLDLPFAIVDLRPAFRRHVLDYFAAEYAQGKTPLPCAPCNREVRFKALLEYADQKGAGWIATGHYARVQEGNILRARDLKKDQSYFLWGLEPEVVSRLRLPIGDYAKEEVRALAKKFGLPTSDKAESQDLCFVGNEDHARFLEEHYPAAARPAGDFVDETGNVLGRHHGLHAYTVGQRRRLGVSLGQRAYVTKLDPEKNEIVLGSKESLRAKGLIAKNPNWIAGRSLLPGPWSLVRIRSTHAGVPAQLEELGKTLQITFQTPQDAVTPGQAAVFYDADRLLGGAWIERAIH
ncbi:MAG: tRNA 2-thiouridine(34) synthase MnmA [Deltaproteobacteria bacterium]|nr:tRNA 2-thiouridine(34) synthase MnmA [Deltaproteobacteria bacterium]